MPARPLFDATRHLIDAVRDALALRSDVQERMLFGSYCFFVDGKLCLGVRGEDLLVRLPPWPITRRSGPAPDALRHAAVCGMQHLLRSKPKNRARGRQRNLMCLKNLSEIE